MLLAAMLPDLLRLLWALALLLSNRRAGGTAGASPTPSHKDSSSSSYRSGTPFSGFSDYDQRCYKDGVPSSVPPGAACDQRRGWNFYYEEQDDACYARRTYLRCDGAAFTPPFSTAAECTNTCSVQQAEGRSSSKESLYPGSDENRCKALSPPSEEEMTGRGCPFKIGFTWDPTEGRCAGRRRCKNGEEVEEEEEKENFFQTQDECMKWCAPIKEKRWHFLVPTAAESNVDGIGPRMGGGGGEGVPMEEYTAEDLGITVYSEGDREEMCSQEAVVGKRGSARPPRGYGCNTYRYKWTYDEGLGKCKRFMSGGCRRESGNAFDTKYDCEAVCEGVWRRRR